MSGTRTLRIRFPRGLAAIGGTQSAATFYVQEKQDEQTLVNLLMRLRETSDLSKVKNCYIKWNGQFVFTGARENSASAPSKETNLCHHTMKTKTKQSTKWS